MEMKNKNIEGIKIEDKRQKEKDKRKKTKGRFEMAWEIASSQAPRNDG
jgi:hypothetical protein